MLRSLIALAALAAFALPASISAQVTQVPGTGCRNAAYPTTVGSPGIGQGFGVISPPCRVNDIPFLVFGATAINLVINPPIACGGPCLLYPRPDIVLPNVSAFRTTIPNDPRLIGLCVCVQSGCVDTQNRCVTLSGALHVCITR